MFSANTLTLGSMQQYSTQPTVPILSPPLSSGRHKGRQPPAYLNLSRSDLVQYCLCIVISNVHNLRVIQTAIFKFYLIVSRENAMSSCNCCCQVFSLLVWSVTIGRVQKPCMASILSIMLTLFSNLYCIVDSH